MANVSLNLLYENETTKSWGDGSDPFKVPQVRVYNILKVLLH